jgi:hypothetical protein
VIDATIEDDMDRLEHKTVNSFGGLRLAANIVGDADRSLLQGGSRDCRGGERKTPPWSAAISSQSTASEQRANPKEPT